MTSALSIPNAYYPEKITMPDGNDYIAVATSSTASGYALFCPDTKRFYKAGRMGKKQSARYMRIISGLHLGASRGERLDFLTLSTKYDKSKPEMRLEKIKYMNYAFTLLKQRIEYYWQKKQYEAFCRKNKIQAYIKTAKKKRKKINPEYRDIWDAFKVKFRYFKVKTAEGGGVMHIVFRKPADLPPLPWHWLRRQWAKIWYGSWNVNIQEINAKDYQRTSMYIVGRYLTKQPVLRMSYGHQWVCLGFVKKFKNIIKTFTDCKKDPLKGYKRAIEVWNKRLDEGDIPKNTRQRSIFGQVGKDGKWHSKRVRSAEMKDPQKQNYCWKQIGIAGENQYVIKGLTLGWWDACIDSPKYCYGGYWKINVLYQPIFVWNNNTVIVSRDDKRSRYRTYQGANKEILPQNG